MRKKADIAQEYIPDPWSGSLREAIRPGRFTLPFSAYIKASFDAARRSAFPASSSATQQLSPAWSALVDTLIKEQIIVDLPLHEKWFTDSPRMYSVKFFADMRRMRTSGHTRIAGFSRGSALQFEVALSKAIGELLERYPLMEYQQEALMRSSTKMLREKLIPHLDPSQLAGFTKEQSDLLPFLRYDEKATLSWVMGKNLIHNEASWVPAQLVFWNYCHHQSRGEVMLRAPNTNGAAGGFSFTEAAIAGMHELLQRDAFLLHWLTKTAPRRIIPGTTQNDSLNRLMGEVEDLNFEVHFLYLTVDHEAPAYVCMLVAKENTCARPKVSMGGGFGGRHEDAMLDALREAITVHQWLRTNEEGKEPVTFNPTTYVSFRDFTINQEKRLRIWAMPEMFQHTAWLLDGDEVSLADLASREPYKTLEPSGEYERLIAYFAAKGEGYEVYAYNAVTPLLAKLGYTSVKIVVPQLLPLYLDEIFAPLSTTRLSLLKPKLSAAKERTFEEVNPLPHPFP